VLQTRTCKKRKQYKKKTTSLAPVAEANKKRRSAQMKSRQMKLWQLSRREGEV
jgi:hypothetical protein